MCIRDRNTPQNKEEYRYRTIFEELFPSETAAATVPSVPSVACSTPIALEWDEAFKKMNDPSGRAVVSVHEAVSYTHLDVYKRQLFVRHTGQQDARATNATGQGGDGLAQQALGQFGKQVFFENLEAAVFPGFANAPSKWRHGVLDKTLKTLSLIHI